MTGPKRNSAFCFLGVRGKAKGNIEVKGRQSSPFPTGSVTECFVIHVPPNSKLEKTACKLFALRWLTHNFELRGITTTFITRNGMCICNRAHLHVHLDAIFTT